MNNSWKAAARDIEQGKIAPVYILTGEEDWARNKFLDQLQRKLIDPSLVDFNFDHLQAAEISGVAVSDKAATLPMMADRRLLVVEGCEQWVQKDLKAILAYIEKSNDSSCLALCFASGDRRKKIFSLRLPHVRYLDFPRPKRWELNGYIRDLALDMGLRLWEDAVALVAEMTGDDLERVHRELDKLSLYKLGSTEIEADDVAGLLGRTRQVTRWELNDFLANRDLAGALVKMNDILDSGEEPIGLLSTINMFLRQLFVVKVLMVKGVREPGRISQAVGVPPRVAETLMRQQAAFSDYELRQAFQLMKATDDRLKSAAMDRRLLLDHLVTQLVMTGAYSPPRQHKKARR